MIDLHTAIDKARLSRRQAEAVAFVYGLDLTQSEAAEVMDVTQQAVAKYIDEAARKIATVYRKWDDKDPDGQYTEVTYIFDGEDVSN